MIAAAVSQLVAETEIKVGEHHTVEIAGLTFNIDTIYCTVIAGVIVCGLGLIMARNATSGVPSKLQLFWEMVVDTTRKQVETTIGPQAAFVVPLAVALFTFILIANWIEIIPSSEADCLKSPTADVNLAYALALTVIVWVHIVAVRQRGSSYVKGFFKPAGQAPIKIIEEIVKPVTLSLRLFGNLFSGGIMIAL